MTSRTPTSDKAKPTAADKLRAADLTQPMDVPGAPTGNGAPVPGDGDGAQADPTRVGTFEPSVPPTSPHPAVEPDASPAGSGRPLVPTDGADDPDMGRAMVALAEIAEHGRWGGTYQDHVGRVRWLHDLAGRATGKLADREHIPAALWGELAAQVTGWADGGGSA